MPIEIMWFTAVGAIVVGVVGPILLYRSTRKTAMTTAEIAKEAAIPAEFAIVVNGMKEVLSAVQGQVIELKRDLAETRAEHEALKEDYTSVKSRVESSERQSFEMIHHILQLEQLVPNPPGPPKRPDWKLPILTERTL